MVKYDRIHRPRYKAIPVRRYSDEIRSPQIKSAESSKMAGKFLPPENSESLSFLFGRSISNINDLYFSFGGLRTTNRNFYKAVNTYVTSTTSDIRRIVSFIKPLFSIITSMALLGHISTQRPHPLHSCSFITACSFST